MQIPYGRCTRSRRRNCPAGFISTLAFKLHCVKLCYHFVCPLDFSRFFQPLPLIKRVCFPMWIARCSRIAKPLYTKGTVWLPLFNLSFYLACCQYKFSYYHLSKWFKRTVVYAKINMKTRQSLFCLGWQSNNILLFFFCLYIALHFGTLSLAGPAKVCF